MTDSLILQSAGVEEMEMKNPDESDDPFAREETVPKQFFGEWRLDREAIKKYLQCDRVVSISELGRKLVISVKDLTPDIGKEYPMLNRSWISLFDAKHDRATLH